MTPISFPGAKKVVTIGNATLVLGDAMAAVYGIQGQSPLVVTDPPYLLTSGGKNSGTMGGVFKAGGDYSNNGKLFCQTPSWPDIFHVLDNATQDRSHLYVMSNSKNLAPLLNAARDRSMHLHHVLVWDKGTVTPNRYHMAAVEFIAFLKKGRARTINNPGTQQIIRIKNPRNKSHPTQKPPQLMEVFIGNSSQPGDLVVDPYMGAGSTGVAALRLGRKFVGFEIDPVHFETACLAIRRHYVGSPCLLSESVA
ncbi:MAG: hypothetical protein COA62_15875 [Rhodobiaceae bacterium]|nr:MAG: hypothetical protein COA62_15875 [Rhodobiaceae bacterium]